MTRLYTVAAALLLILFSCTHSPEAELEPIPLDETVLTPHNQLKYYGVDNVTAQEISLVRQALGTQVNLIIEGVDCNDFETLEQLITQAEEQNCQLIIWPHGYGHQWTPWRWDAASETWDISDGHAFLDYLANYQANGGQAIHSFLMSHEPFWNHGEPFSSQQMKDLYALLEAYAPGLDKFLYVGNLAYNEQVFPQYWENVDIRIEEGLADVVCIWWHGFGGQEGAPSYDQVIARIEEDVALIQERNLDMEILFALQCFGWDPYGYAMPTAQEILDLGNRALNVQGLDGIVWYCWGSYDAYTDCLRDSRFDSRSRDRHRAIQLLMDQAQ